jgi:hypothetical protein
LALQLGTEKAGPRGAVWKRAGEVYFTLLLQDLLHRALHAAGEANSRETQEMNGKDRSYLDAAQTGREAGATPPFDARCVTVAVGSLPPQSRAARDPFSRVPEPEFRSCKTTFITNREWIRKVMEIIWSRNGDQK